MNILVDAANDEIVARVVANDLAITADIPLAAEVLDRDTLELTSIENTCRSA